MRTSTTNAITSKKRAVKTKTSIRTTRTLIEKQNNNQDKKPIAGKNSIRTIRKQTNNNNSTKTRTKKQEAK